MPSRPVPEESVEAAKASMAEHIPGCGPRPAAFSPDINAAAWAALEAAAPALRKQERAEFAAEIGESVRLATEKGHEEGRRQVLQEMAAAFETRKKSEAMLCSEVAAYCREQAARSRAYQFKGSRMAKSQGERDG